MTDTVRSGPARNRRRLWLTILSIAALLLAVAFFSLTMGRLQISFLEALSALYDRATEPSHRVAVLDLRLPRLLVGLGAGAALALSGLVLQAIVRNPLADPGIVGVSAGASLAVTTLLAITGEGSRLAVMTAAVAGGLGASALVGAIGLRGRAMPLRLVLAGIGVGALAGALTTMTLLGMRVSEAQSALNWLSGSLSGRGWDEVVWLWFPLIGIIAIVGGCLRPLDILQFGEATAIGVGLRLTASRVALLVLAVVAASLATAAAGLIAFVGLAAPHLARHLGGPRHANSVPLALMIGALLCAAADLLGRTLTAPIEVPAGVVTAILGAPYLLWLLRARHAN